MHFVSSDHSAQKHLLICTKLYNGLLLIPLESKIHKYMWYASYMLLEIPQQVLSTPEDETKSDKWLAVVVCKFQNVELSTCGRGRD